jgi:uncharacterized membrane protein
VHRDEEYLAERARVTRRAFFWMLLLVALVVLAALVALVAAIAHLGPNVTGSVTPPGIR